jgi:hypothetical protein
VAKPKKRIFRWGISLLCILLVGFGAYQYVSASRAKEKTKNPYTAFVLQAYDKITTDYWENPAEYQTENFGGLPALFKETLRKLTGTMYPISNRADLEDALNSLFADTSNATTSELRAATVVASALDNMWPHTVPNRNGLNVDRAEQAFQNIVNNQHPERDRYAALGLRDQDKTTYSRTDIDKALASKEQQLVGSTSVEAKQQLQEAQNSYAILSDQNSKKRYDVSKAEPTASSRVISDALYIKISQNAPQTSHEFTETVDSAVRAHPNLTSLILDLRGNLGGYDNVASEIVGDFAGSSTPFYTVKTNVGVQQFVTSNDALPVLKRFTSRVVLTDDHTKSTGELMSQALRRTAHFVLVGTTTGGWGTIENGNGFPMKSSFASGNHYFLRLVIGATLTDAFQLIEGHGVRPDIDVTAANWKTDLAHAFPGSSLLKTIPSLF